MPVIVLAGEEDFLLGRRVAELKAELVAPQWEAFNYVRLINPSLQTITDNLASLPFGDGNKMILIDRCELFTKKKSAKDESDGDGKASKHELDDFNHALVSVAENTYAVFACPHNFDKNLRTSKTVSAHARIEEFVKQKYYPGSRKGNIETWCRKEAKLHGATIDDDAIYYLVDSTEADLRAIAMEVSKAATYLLPEKHITLDVVKKLSAYHSHVFTLADAWAAGNRQEALASLDELLKRQSGIPIIAFLHTTISRWLDTKACADKLLADIPGGAGVKRREISLSEMARKVALEINSRDWLVETDLKRIRGLSLNWLVEKRLTLCELENLVKTGQMSDKHALVSFISG
jgi:DNA polymerase III subunit delta